jgi:hypothetical protein
MTTQVAQWRKAGGKTGIKELVAAATFSAAVSAVIAAIPGKLVGSDGSHLFFVMAVVLLALPFGSMKFEAWRVTPGFVFVVFLSEPIGQMIFREKAAQSYLLLALPLLFAAYFSKLR